jgi:ribonuclease HI
VDLSFVTIWENQCLLAQRVDLSFVSPAMDALAAETTACLFALEAAERHGISRVELETDSSQVREAITSYIQGT